MQCRPKRNTNNLSHLCGTLEREADALSRQELGVSWGTSELHEKALLKHICLFAPLNLKGWSHAGTSSKSFSDNSYIFSGWEPTALNKWSWSSKQSYKIYFIVTQFEGLGKQDLATQRDLATATSQGVVWLEAHLHDSGSKPVWQKAHELKSVGLGPSLGSSLQKLSECSKSFHCSPFILGGKNIYFLLLWGKEGEKQVG